MRKKRPWTTVALIAVVLFAISAYLGPRLFRREQTVERLAFFPGGEVVRVARLPKGGDLELLLRREADAPGGPDSATQEFRVMLLDKDTVKNMDALVVVAAWGPLDSAPYVMRGVMYPLELDRLEFWVSFEHRVRGRYVSAGGGGGIPVTVEQLLPTSPFVGMKYENSVEPDADWHNGDLNLGWFLALQSEHDPSTRPATRPSDLRPPEYARRFRLVLRHRSADRSNS